MKGILFKTNMIQAIVEGRKTQTRRVIKPQPTKPIGTAHDWEWKPGGMLCYDDYFREHAPNHARYRVGETVYIEEAWMIEHNIKGCPKLDDLVTIHYSNASTSRRWGDIIDNEAGVFLISVSKAFDKSGYEQPPMFMPEVLARHFITILAVRAERLQEITETDAEWEGTPMVQSRPSGVSKDDYKVLWNSINPKYPWESNPWVFAYTFRLKGGDENEATQS